MKSFPEKNHILLSQKKGTVRDPDESQIAIKEQSFCGKRSAREGENLDKEFGRPHEQVQQKIRIRQSARNREKKLVPVLEPADLQVKKIPKI